MEYEGSPRDCGERQDRQEGTRRTRACPPPQRRRPPAVLGAGTAPKRGGNAGVHRVQHDHTRSEVSALHQGRTPPPRDEADRERGGAHGNQRGRAGGRGAAVKEQIESEILLQLHALRRSSIGSIDLSLPVFPPQRVYDYDRRSWPRISSDADEFVLCHNDLGPRKIFVHPDTYHIVGIVGWEFAGFFPKYFELPLWKEFDWKKRQAVCDKANERELAFFGLKAEDLQDDLLPDCPSDSALRSTVAAMN